MHTKAILFIISLCFFVWTKPSKAQTAEFGKVPLEELTRNYDEKDSTAAAVILSDIGESVIEYREQFEIRHTRKVRIKIYNRQGLDWANVSIPYYTQNPREVEVVKDIEGFTYNIEGGVITRKEMDDHAVYHNKLSEKWSEKVFALPNVKEGSVIEYRYTVISPFLFNLRDWQFQYSIPVRWSEYEVKIPAFYEYQILYHGYHPLEVKESEVIRRKEKWRNYEYQNVRYKWALKDVPAFHNENFITTEDDYLAKITFQLSKVNYPDRIVKEYMTTWPKLVKDYLDLWEVDKYLKKKDGEEIVAALTRGIDSEMDKVAVLYQYIHSNLGWNSKRGIYPSKSPRKTLDEKNGNCTDINIILHNMLKMAGIDVIPVLLSTRDHGHVNAKFPVLDEFNYLLVFAKIEGKEYLFDATDPDLPLGMIPTACINGYGLILDPDAERWLNLYSGVEYNLSTHVICRYDAQQERFVAQVSNVYKGYASSMQRKKIKDSQREEAVDYTGVVPEALKISGMDSLQQPVQVVFETPYAYDRLGENIYVGIADFAHFNENPFKAPERNFPVDFGFNRTYRYTFNLEIPAGYRVDEYPSAESIALEDKSVQFVLQTHANNMNVQLLGIVKINNPIVEASQYQQLRAIYDTILSKYSEKIVLKKIIN